MERGEFNASLAPFGYELVNKELVIVPNKAKIVRGIFAEYLQGKGVEQIASALNADEIPPPVAKKWYKSTIQYILTNEKYIGDTLYQKKCTTETLPFIKQRNYGEQEQICKMLFGGRSMNFAKTKMKSYLL